MKSGSQAAKRIVSLMLSTVAIVICVCMIFNFISARESYEAKVSNQNVIAEQQNEQIKKNHLEIVKLNSDIDKQQKQVSALSEQLSSAKNEYNRLSKYDEAKIAYLTFDDGPSNNTHKILEILKKYDVKATFFVTAQDKVEYMKNITDAGHTIGLHSYTHDWDIYTNTDTYFNDLNKIHDLVKSKTGVDSKVIRFPGGSSNTVSRSYDGGAQIMSKVTKMVEEKGYAYFDWNCDSTDASGNGIAASTLVSNTLAAATPNHICVLMHDAGAKGTTVDALPQIIEGLKSKGYSFDKLTVKTPAEQFHHGINN